MEDREQDVRDDRVGGLAVELEVCPNPDRISGFGGSASVRVANELRSTTPRRPPAKETCGGRVRANVPRESRPSEGAMTPEQFVEMLPYLLNDVLIGEHSAPLRKSNSPPLCEAKSVISFNESETSRAGEPCLVRLHVVG